MKFVGFLCLPLIVLAGCAPKSRSASRADIVGVWIDNDTKDGSTHGVSRAGLKFLTSFFEEFRADGTYLSVIHNESDRRDEYKVMTGTWALRGKDIEVRQQKHETIVRKGPTKPKTTMTNNFFVYSDVRVTGNVLSCLDDPPLRQYWRRGKVPADMNPSTWLAGEGGARDTESGKQP